MNDIICGESVSNELASPVMSPRIEFNDSVDSRSNASSSPEAYPIIPFLVRLGNLVLQTDKREWMTVEDLYELAGCNNMKIGAADLQCGDLESQLLELFRDREEIYTEGVNVIGCLRREKWDLVFMLRFYRYNPDWRAVNPMTPAESCLPEYVNN